ncbi:MAG: nucleoside recognition domain-containing protein [Clostridia bacterium]|nr:nucleoside recognition domain-containing protein [Clostridia bacterium]
MLNYIWGGMIVVSFICALITGRMEELSQAAINGADKAVSLIISMAGVMCLWTGIMKIADKGGLTAIIAKILSPVLSRLMPDYKKDSAAMRAVSANITANILGLGNAATPFGLIAMKEMQKENRLKTKPNNSMVMFVVMNTASIQLIPTTIAALRQAAGSKQPYDILPYIWIVSFLSLAVGIILAKVFSRKT